MTCLVRTFGVLGTALSRLVLERGWGLVALGILFLAPDRKSVV